MVSRSPYTPPGRVDVHLSSFNVCVSNGPSLAGYMLSIKNAEDMRAVFFLCRDALEYFGNQANYNWTAGKEAKIFCTRIKRLSRLLLKSLL